VQLKYKELTPQYSLSLSNGISPLGDSDTKGPETAVINYNDPQKRNSTFSPNTAFYILNGDHFDNLEKAFQDEKIYGLFNYLNSHLELKSSWSDDWGD